MFAYSTIVRTHTLGQVRCLSPLRVPFKHFTDLTSPLSAWLFGPHHSPVLHKAAVKTWEEPMREKLVYIGGAKYFIAPSIALCDCVVYAVNTGETNGPLAARCPCITKTKTFCRPTGKMPGVPDYTSSWRALKYQVMKPVSSVSDGQFVTRLQCNVWNNEFVNWLVRSVRSVKSWSS